METYYDKQGRELDYTMSKNGIIKNDVQFSYNEKQKLASLILETKTSLLDKLDAGEANGIATLDENGVVPIDQLPEIVDSHNKGFFADQTALETAHPTGADGDYAILGSTDSVWTWDSDTNAWLNTNVQPSTYWSRNIVDEFLYLNNLGDNVVIGKNTNTSVNHIFELSRDAGLSTVYARLENTNTTDGNATYEIVSDNKVLSISTGRLSGSSISSNDELKLKDKYLTDSIPLSETGVTALNAGLSASSIIGAINEIYTSSTLWSRDIANTTTYLENVADKVLIGTNNPAYATDILNLVNTSADTSLIKIQGNNIGYMKIGCYDDGVNPTTAYIDYNQGDNTDFKISNSDQAVDVLVFKGSGESYFARNKKVYFDGMGVDEGAWITVNSGTGIFELGAGNGAGYLLKLSSENQVFINSAITSLLMNDARATGVLNLLGGLSGSVVLKIDSVDGSLNGSDAGIEINADVDNGSGAGYIVLRNNGRYGLEIGGNGSIIGGNSNADPFRITTEYSGTVNSNDTEIQTGNVSGNNTKSGNLYLRTGESTGSTNCNSGNVIIFPGSSSYGNKGYSGAVGTFKIANGEDFAEKFFNVGEGIAEIGDIDGINNGIYLDFDTLSGRGLATIHSGDLKIEGSISTNIQTETSASVTVTRAHGTILCNCTSNAITLNLPQANTVTGMIFIAKKIDSTTNTMTLDAYSTELIDTTQTISTSTQNEGFILQSNGTGYVIIGRY